MQAVVQVVVPLVGLIQEVHILLLLRMMVNP